MSRMRDKQDTKLYYSISEASAIAKVKPHVLRYWETQFKMLRPKKNKAGNRMYRRRDLRLIQLIKELLYDKGFTIAGARRKLLDERTLIKNQIEISFSEADRSRMLLEVIGDLKSLIRDLQGRPRLEAGGDGNGARSGAGDESAPHDGSDLHDESDLHDDSGLHADSDLHEVDEEAIAAGFPDDQDDDEPDARLSGVGGQGDDPEDSFGGVTREGSFFAGVTREGSLSEGLTREGIYSEGLTRDGIIREQAIGEGASSEAALSGGELSGAAIGEGTAPETAVRDETPEAAIADETAPEAAVRETAAGDDGHLRAAE